MSFAVGHILLQGLREQREAEIKELKKRLAILEDEPIAMTHEEIEKQLGHRVIIVS